MFMNDVISQDIKKNKILVAGTNTRVFSKVEELLRINKFEVLRESVLITRSMNNKPIRKKNAQAILLTSSNAAIYFSKRFNSKNIPVFVIGPTTAKTAQECGFKNVKIYGNTAEKLVFKIKNTLNPIDGEIIFAGGKDLSLNIPKILSKEGYAIRREILYSTFPSNKLTSRTYDELSGQKTTCVALLSPKGAHAFCKIAEKQLSKVVFKNLNAVCLSHRVAKSAIKGGMKNIFFASTPKAEELVSLAIKLYGE